VSASPATFAHRCGVDSEQRNTDVRQVIKNIESSGVELVRLGWCDTHGMLRGKTLTTAAAIKALDDGVGMVGTLLLKDTGDRTAYKVFEPGGTADLPAGFAGASNLMLLPDPTSFQVLPWATGTGWLRCQPWFQDGTPVPLDTRRVLQTALDRLAERGLGLVCGLEVEFHIYRIKDTHHGADLDPELAAWPGLPPAVSLIHPGFNMLSEGWADMTDEPLRIVQHTAQALGLALTSLEIELGPSQVEAVFAATDALTAADNMVRFRNGVRQALRRAGYHATFMCRPPFAHIMSSGWHLHQSVVSLATGANALVRPAPAPGATPLDATHTLSDTGSAWLAGLLAHAQGMTALCAPTVNGFGRFQPNALAPHAAVWGSDNRGAMLRVVGGAGDPATRIENRLGEPAANPYLYMAAQVYAGLDGLARGLVPPLATESPYAAGSDPSRALPTSLPLALEALAADEALTAGLGEDWVRYFTRIKQSECQRHAQAEDKLGFERREYFSRF
jgi:glutamine synthetase